MWAVRLEEEEEEAEGSVRFDESGERSRRDEENARGVIRRKLKRRFTWNIVARLREIQPCCSTSLSEVLGGFRSFVLCMYALQSHTSVVDERHCRPCKSRSRLLNDVS